MNDEARCSPSGDDGKLKQEAPARIAEGDAETAQPLSDTEVERHFAERLALSLAARATP